MWLVLFWVLGFLGVGSFLFFWLFLNIGGIEEQQVELEKVLREFLEFQVFQDDFLISFKKVFQISLFEFLRIKLELDGDSYILELLQNRELVLGCLILVWYQFDGIWVVSEGYILENCCYQGRVWGYVGFWVFICICFGFRGLVVLILERSYILEQGFGDFQGFFIIF